MSPPKSDHVPDIPIIAEFCYKNKISRQRLYEFDELTDVMELIIAKKEAQLERQALKNEIDHSMAIFSLKQLGWSDRQKIEQDNFNYDLSKLPESYLQRIINHEDAKKVIMEYESTNAGGSRSGSNSDS